MNKSDFFVRTGRANANFVIGAGVVLSLFICSMLGLSCYSEPQEKEFFIILWCPFIVLGGWLIWFAWWVKYDYFKADSKGITIDVHSNSPFPKHIQRSYRWEELSAYSLDADHIEKSAYTISHWRYTLKLYGANGQLLEKIKPHTLFDGNLQGLDGYISKYLPSKPVYDLDKYNKVTFPDNSAKILLVVGYVILLIGILWSGLFAFLLSDLEEIAVMLLFGVIFCACGTSLIRESNAAKSDCISIDPNCITADMRSGQNERMHKVIAHDSYQSFSFCDGILKLYDKDEKEMFSCSCSNLENSQYLGSVLDLVIYE